MIAGLVDGHRADGLGLVRVRASQGFCNAGISCMLGSLNYVADANGKLA